MKQYVSVTARFDADGNIIPLCVNWRDGRRFPIDKVTDVRFAAAEGAGSGIRYTCRIRSKVKYIFLEENRWFIAEQGA